MLCLCWLLIQTAFGVGQPFGQMHAAPQSFEHFRLGQPGDLHLIRFLDAVARMGEQVGQFAVVGDQDQTFARHVEPADHEQPLAVGREIDHARPAIGIASRRDDAERFVDQIIDQPAARQRLAIDANIGRVGIDLRAERGDGAAIDGDAAGGDQFFAFSPAADSGRSQQLLQPHGSFGRLAG